MHKYWTLTWGTIYFRSYLLLYQTWLYKWSWLLPVIVSHYNLLGYQAGCLVLPQRQQQVKIHTSQLKSITLKMQCYIRLIRWIDIFEFKLTLISKTEKQSVVKLTKSQHKCNVKILLNLVPSLFQLKSILSSYSFWNYWRLSKV